MAKFLMHSLCSVAAATVLLASSAIAQSNAPARNSLEKKVLVVTGSFGGGGGLFAVDRQPPWSVKRLADVHSVSGVVQTGFGMIFLIEPDTDQVRVFDHKGNERHTIQFAAGSNPRDIMAVKRNRAYVTRSNATHLYVVNPQTGFGHDLIDLSIFADEDGIPEMERMIRDKKHLYVQLRRQNNESGAAEEEFIKGRIAVIDLATETLVDVNPETPAIDAIELFGPTPRLRMHVDNELKYLLVSATNGHHLDLNGGVELIDLNTFQSQGFLLDEETLAALGGFAMKNPREGYFLFHTDIVPSNHLITFTVPGGAILGPEIVFDFGNYLDSLLFDPGTNLLYMPQVAGGLFVVDTTTDMEIPASPIALPGFPVDMVLGPVGRRFDLTGDAVVNVFDLLDLLAGWGSCGSACPETCIPDIATETGPGSDCQVDVFDLLALLGDWG